MPIPNLSKQQIFDAVVTHLYAQGRAALNRKGNCSYKTIDGEKCAIGCLIPDDEYSPRMEGRRLPGLISSLTFKKVFVNLMESDGDVYKNGTRLHLLGELQNFHDYSFPRTSINNDMPRAIINLRRLAVDFNLNPSVIDLAEVGKAA